MAEDHPENHDSQQRNSKRNNDGQTHEIKSYASMAMAQQLAAAINDMVVQKDEDQIVGFLLDTFNEMADAEFEIPDHGLPREIYYKREEERNERFTNFKESFASLYHVFGAESEEQGRSENNKGLQNLGRKMRSIAQKLDSHNP